MELTIKIVGATSIILCGFLVAKFFIDQSGRKLTILTEVVDLFSFIHNNFYYRRSSVVETLEEAQKIERVCLDLKLDNFSNVDYKAELDDRIGQSDGLNKLLTTRQREMFCDALKNIGVGSLDEECSRLEYFISYFKSELEIFTGREMKNRRVCLGMCIYASLVLTVILF